MKTTPASCIFILKVDLKVFYAVSVTETLLIHSLSPSILLFWSCINENICFLMFRDRLCFSLFAIFRLGIANVFVHATFAIRCGLVCFSCRILEISENRFKHPASPLPPPPKYFNTDRSKAVLVVPCCYLFLLSVFILWFTYYVSDIF